jgi:hypothetical protein
MRRVGLAVVALAFAGSALAEEPIREVSALVREEY